MDRHKARSLPLPFFEEWYHRHLFAKDETSRKTPQVGTGLYAGPRPPPALLNVSAILRLMHIRRGLSATAACLRLRRPVVGAPGADKPRIYGD
ncbi:MAG TPA: hypothetical protein VL485_27090 [Ktedonobacteraceae bacterium]|nr:hypothetical protein [Ktedonobacteraceae bacterium]